MRNRIGTRLIVGVGMVTVLVIGSMSFLILRQHTAQLVLERTRSANQLSETIKSSTHFDMLENRRDSLHRQIRAIGLLNQEGIRKVRLFNKEGQIMFSSDEDEIGTSLDKQAEACYACHARGRPLERLDKEARVRFFPGENGERVLGIINPIPNEPSCSTAKCHEHDPNQRLLGVLDVNISMAEADHEIARARVVLASLAALAIVATSLILWWLNRSLVIQPVAALVEGTRRVAEGDLTTQIAVTAKHELGDLARSFNDMTRRLADSQRQLYQADKLASVGQLAAGVAHEINNPLTGVLSYASLLQKRLTADAETREDLEVIIRETLRCREIIRGLLDFARPVPPARRPTDLNEVVRHAASVVKNPLADHQVDLDLSLAKDLPPAHADANQIQQVVVNLLLNAANAIGSEGGGIHVTTREAEGATVEIEVQDSGRGIAPENLSRVFEPFFTTRGTSGTGLGLAVTWGIVEGHGGTIEVRSEVGQGSCFTVRLPQVSTAPPANPASSKAREASS